MAHRTNQRPPVIPATANTPITPVNSNSVTLSVSGVDNHTIRADARLNAVAGAQNRLSLSANGLRVAPTSTTRVVTATGTVTSNDTTLIVQNGATNITLTISGAFDPGHELTFSRAAGSTGTITLVAPGFTIQALAGTVGGSTTIPAHSAAGAGVSNRFVLVGTVWYRIS